MSITLTLIVFKNFLNDCHLVSFDCNQVVVDRQQTYSHNLKILSKFVLLPTTHHFTQWPLRAETACMGRDMFFKACSFESRQKDCAAVRAAAFEAGKPNTAFGRCGTVNYTVFCKLVSQRPSSRRLTNKGERIGEKGHTERFISLFQIVHTKPHHV